MWRTRRRSPGVTYIRDRRPGPPEAPAGPRCASAAAGLCGSGAPSTRWSAGEGRKGGTKADGRAGVAVAATSAASSCARRCPQPSRARTPGTCRCRWHLPPAAATTARPGTARPREPAHPPRSLTRRAGGGMGGGGNGPSSREIRSEPPREFSNARDTAPGAGDGGLWTTDPGVLCGVSGRFRPCPRSRPCPGGCCLSRGTLGAVVPRLAGPAPFGARPWGRLWSPVPHLVGTALLFCPALREPPAGEGKAGPA